MLTMSLTPTVTGSLLLCFLLFLNAAGRKTDLKDQKTITAESGQNVTLTCRAPNNNNIMAIKWSRADLGSDYVLLYRDDQFVPDYQHPSFKNRVDLQDRQMKDGDVSLILKDVTINDDGTYECRVFMRKTRAGNPISIIYLVVVGPPGQPGGSTEDGGEKDGGKEDGGKEDGGKEGGSVGLIVGLSVSALLLVAVVGFVVGYRKCKGQKQDPYEPPAELQPV